MPLETKIWWQVYYLLWGVISFRPSDDRAGNICIYQPVYICIFSLTICVYSKLNMSSNWCFQLYHQKDHCNLSPYLPVNSYSNQRNLAVTISHSFNCINSRISYSAMRIFNLLYPLGKSLINESIMIMCNSFCISSLTDSFPKLLRLAPSPATLPCYLQEDIPYNWNVDLHSPVIVYSHFFLKFSNLLNYFLICIQ